MSGQFIAQSLGFDISTTGVSVGIRSFEGEEGFADVAMQGATEWDGQPTFDLSAIPKMMLEALQGLQGQGWLFLPPEDGEKKTVSWSIRQHDMVILGACGQLLMPALSWQCNAAAEAKRLNGIPRLVSEVGPIEPRFILPKFRWALDKYSSLERKIGGVMTTGDWVGAGLTRETRLSISDALSNGLINQETRELSALALGVIDVPVKWFPSVIESGTELGVVVAGNVAEEWSKVATLIDGWMVVAGLADNHATGVGCGLADEETIVVSAGTSGKVVRLCDQGDALVGNAACFEYYHSRLLLMILHECADWYDRFLASLGGAEGYDYWDRMVLGVMVGDLKRVSHEDGVGEIFLEGWESLSTYQKVASTQYSIACELLLLVGNILREVNGKERTITKLVLTGGLSQSQFFRDVIKAGVKLLDENITVMRSTRQGPLVFQTAAYGALVNGLLVD